MLRDSIHLSARIIDPATRAARDIYAGGNADSSLSMQDNAAIKLVHSLAAPDLDWLGMHHDEKNPMHTMPCMDLASAWRLTPTGLSKSMQLEANQTHRPISTSSRADGGCA